MSREPRIATGRHRQALRQLRPRFASLRQGDLREGLCLSQCTTGVRACEQREAFRKGGARTAAGRARKAAHLQAHSHRSHLSGQIGKPARVVAMHMGRWLRAFRTRSVRLTRSQH